MPLGFVRSFIACGIDQALVPRIREIQDTLKAESDSAGVKWIDPENLHFTLKFLGEIDEGIIANIREGIMGVAESASSFDLAISGLGAFPSVSRPRVIWLGTGNGKEKLRALAREIEEMSASYGIPKEGKVFVPHLTLGRVKSDHGLRGLAETIQRLASVEVGITRVSEICLMRSDLKRSGPVYTVLECVRLTKQGK